MILAMHIAFATVAAASALAALALRKGGAAHAWAGRSFVAAMALMLAFAAVLAIRSGKADMVVGSALILYCAATGWWTMRSGGVAGGFERAMVGVPILCVLAGLFPAGGSRAGAAIFGLMAAGAAIGDIRYLARGTLDRAAKLRRHVWRMCVPAFAATGSAFLGQAKHLPMFLRHWGLLAPLALAPLIVMAYWLVRARTPRTALGSTA